MLLLGGPAMAGSASDAAAALQNLEECTKSSTLSGIVGDVPKFGNQLFMNCLGGWTYWGHGITWAKSLIDMES
jgi:hypothetical protein